MPIKQCFILFFSQAINCLTYVNIKPVVLYF